MSAARVIVPVRHWLARFGSSSAQDAVLVGRFVRDRDEEAFAALLDRHGPMVLGVARRILGDHHTAEDVFQATFLRLASTAGHLRQPAALPAWLHRTAHNLAVTALRRRQRRDRAEAEAVRRQPDDPLDDLSSRELLRVLDEELQRLPERFRLPLVLCCLEGRSQDEAAALLGWTPGSVKGRLERGRQRLKDRLARRGLTFAVGAGVPLMMTRPTVAAVLRQATLQIVGAGSQAPPAVLALANAVSEPLAVASWRVLLLAAAAGLLGAGVGLALWSASAGPRTAAGDEAAVSPMPPRDALPEGAVARLGSSRLRIGNSAFALTPDGRAIVTVSPEGIVRRFDAATGRLLERRQLGDRRDVNPTGQWAAHLSADGRTAAITTVGAARRGLTIWNVPSGRAIFRRTPAADLDVGAAAVSPDGKRVAFCEYSSGPRSTQTLSVYDLPTGRVRAIGETEFNVYGIHFSADSRRVFLSQTSSVTPDATFACYDVPAAKELWRRPRKGQEFAVSPDGKILLCAGWEQSGFQVIETDPDSGKPTERFLPSRGFHAHPNVHLVIAPDNRTVVMNHFDGIVLCDLRTGEKIRQFAPPKTGGRGWGPELGAFSADGRTMVTNLGYLQRWDLMTGKPFFEEPPDDGLLAPIENLTFTPDGKQIFAQSFYINAARWDVATGTRVGPAGQRLGRVIVPTPEGLRVLGCDSFRSPHEITVFDPISGKALQTVRWAQPGEFGVNGLRAYALTADCKILLIAHGNEPSAGPQTTSVTACDVKSGRRLVRFTVPGRLQFPRSPFSPCGRWAVLGGKVYHVGTGTALFTPAGDAGERLLAGDWRGDGPVWFSDDGRLLAGRLLPPGGKESAETLAVWELASGKILVRFPKAGSVAQIAFAPDGRTIALLDGRGVRIHDLLTGKCRAEYAAPDVSCYFTDRGRSTETLVFAPDGRTLATGHQDGTVLLWKVSSPDDETPPLTEDERSRLWADLRNDSPARARRAVQRLARRPADAVALLTTRFRPPSMPVDPALAGLIRDLDSDAFATRDRASRKIREYGAKAEPLLRRELAGAPTLEKRRRLDELLAAIGQSRVGLPLSGDTLRGVRAIEVLARVGTAEARALLREWVGQARNARLAAEARTALERDEAVSRHGRPRASRKDAKTQRNAKN
jgi:RNA polymerase sigma factor (sigma-70 family)